MYTLTTRKLTICMHFIFPFYCYCIAKLYIEYILYIYLGAIDIIPTMVEGTLLCTDVK